MSFLPKPAVKSLWTRRALALGAAALIASASAMVAGAQAAHAADPAVCEELQLCLYTEPNDAGNVQLITPQPDGVCVDLEPSFKGQISSIRNRTNRFVNLFLGDNCAGTPDYIDGGVGYPDLRVQEIDNLVRSVMFKHEHPASDPCSTRSNLCMYDDANFAGEVQVISKRPINTCVDLHPSFKGRPGSLRNKLPGQDIALFDGDRCTGASTTVNAGEPRGDLSAVNFGNRLRSVRMLTAPLPECLPAQRALCLYADPAFGGDQQIITAPSGDNGCVDIKPSLAGKVSSLRNFSNDPELKIFAGSGCTGSALRIDPWETIIVDLSRKRFDDRAMSVKFKDACDVVEGNVCVWENNLNTGARQVIAPRPEGSCVNLEPSLRGKISSIANNSRQRLHLFAGDNCTGAYDFIERGVGYPNLRVQEFDDVMRSVKFISPPMD